MKERGLAATLFLVSPVRMRTNHRALCRNRTDDLLLTMEMRYRLCQEGVTKISIAARLRPTKRIQLIDCRRKEMCPSKCPCRRRSNLYDQRVPAIDIRRVSPADSEAIRHIYNAEVDDSTVTMDLIPRTAEAQDEWIRRHMGVHGAIVAADVDETTGRDRIIGYASISPWREKAGYSTTVENSVYVHRAHQGRGVGRILLDGILHIASESGFHACMARIVAGHEASIRLHASRGYDIVGVEREVARKFGRWIDITVMQKILA
jgi:L-amino acid N-acyltransferase